MATAPTQPSFTVSQRLLRGYGPLAVFAALLLLMDDPIQAGNHGQLRFGGGAQFRLDRLGSIARCRAAPLAIPY